MSRKVGPSSIFQKSFDKFLKKYSDLNDAYIEFIESKSKEPPERYGTNDYKLRGGKLKGVYHCHLAPDAILIYDIYSDILKPILIVTHDQIKKEKLSKNLAKTLKPHLDKTKS